MLDSTVFDFPAKKVCLHLLHVEKDWVEFSAVHKLFNKDGPFGPSFQTIFPFLMTMLTHTDIYAHKIFKGYIIHHTTELEALQGCNKSHSINHTKKL